MITLTFSFTPKLRRGIGSNISLREKTAIKVLKELNIEPRIIAKIFCTTTRSVNRILSKKSRRNKKGQGRPKITTVKQDRKITKVCRQYKRRGTKVLSSVLKRKYGVDCEKKTNFDGCLVGISKTKTNNYKK